MFYVLLLVTAGSQCSRWQPAAVDAHHTLAVRSEQQAEEPSKIVSETSNMHFKAVSKPQQYNIPSNQDKGLNEPNFITLGKIPEEEQKEIIKTEFERQAEGIISLKEYYESKDPYSLFQSKGYRIKYESIRKNNLYKQLKMKTNENSKKRKFLRVLIEI